MASLFAAGSCSAFEPLTNEASSESVIDLNEHPASYSKTETTMLREIARSQSKAQRRRVTERMRQNGYSEYRSHKDIRRQLGRQYHTYEDPFREAVHRYNLAHRQALHDLNFDVPDPLPLHAKSGRDKPTYTLIKEIMPMPRPSPGSALDEFLMSEKSLPMSTRGQLKLPNIVPAHRWGN